MKKLDKETIQRMEGISNIEDAVNDLYKDGFTKKEIAQYVWQFK